MQKPHRGHPPYEHSHTQDKVFNNVKLGEELIEEIVSGSGTERTSTVEEQQLATTRLVETLGKMKNAGPAQQHIGRLYDGLHVFDSTFAGVYVNDIQQTGLVKPVARMYTNPDTNQWWLQLDPIQVIDISDIEFRCVIAEEVTHLYDYHDIVQKEGIIRHLDRQELTQTEINARISALMVYRETKKETKQSFEPMDSLSAEYDRIMLMRAVRLISQTTADTRLHEAILKHLQDIGY